MQCSAQCGAGRGAQRAITAVAFLAVIGHPAAAQGATRAAGQVARACGRDTTGAWYRRQRAWADESRHDWSDDALRSALLDAAGLGASSAVGALPGFEVVGEQLTATGADSGPRTRLLDSLRALARNRQAPWPTRSVVGAAGVRAVWLLVARDTALSRTALHRMMEAGPDESPPAAVATLEDRLRIGAGRKQIYGTQLSRAADGTLALAPLEDREHVDLRREAAGLPPLGQTLCAARALGGR